MAGGGVKYLLLKPEDLSSNPQNYTKLGSIAHNCNSSKTGGGNR